MIGTCGSVVHTVAVKNTGTGVGEGVRVMVEVSVGVGGIGVAVGGRGVGVVVSVKVAVLASSKNPGAQLTRLVMSKIDKIKKWNFPVNLITRAQVDDKIGVLG